MLQYINKAVPSIAIFIYYYDLNVIVVHTSTLITLLLKFTRWCKTWFFSKQKLERKSANLRTKCRDCIVSWPLW